MMRVKCCGPCRQLALNSIERHARASVEASFRYNPENPISMRLYYFILRKYMIRLAQLIRRFRILNYRVAKD